MKAIDLFCGCGGLSAGLKDAGFEIVAGVDVEPKYIQTFSFNFPNSLSICEDLSASSPESILDRTGLRRGELELLAGGPPCQGFSKNVPRSKRKLDSNNNKLIDTFLKYCEGILPVNILMENVAEMKNGYNSHYTELIESKLCSLGYKVTHGVHNAADFGVPQRRRRAFFIASLEKKPSSPPPTHNIKAREDLFSSYKPHVCVWDAISDLPPLSHGEGNDKGNYYCEPQNEYQNTIRKDSIVVNNHVAKLLKPVQYERISSILPGQGIKDLPKHIRPKGGYSGAYGRLTKDMVMPTITRWLFHPGSGRWGHPVDKRLITIREAARLHGFKDTFIFQGTYVQQAGQLGNAVPPLLATKIAESLISSTVTTASPR